MGESKVVKVEWQFYNLIELILRRQVAIPVLATAIELGGIYGWDRFGRFRLFKGPDDPHIDRVLDALAAEFDSWWHDSKKQRYSLSEAAPNVDIYMEASPEELGPLYWGWKPEHLPDFDQISANGDAMDLDPKSPKAYSAVGGQTKGENYNLALIGAFLEMFEGTSAKMHPDYENMEQLANFFGRQYGGAVGTKSSLVKKFTAARKVLLDKLNQ